MIIIRTMKNNNKNNNNKNNNSYCASKLKYVLAFLIMLAIYWDTHSNCNIYS